MASAGILASALTQYNGAVLDVRKLLFDAILEPDSLSKLCKIMPHQKHGEKLGLIGEFGLVGKAAQGCNPTYGTDAISARELEWDIKPWGVYEKICYEDLETTFLTYLLNKKTNIGDLTSGEIYAQYVASIVYPRLKVAIEKMLIRFAWFGDKNADTNTNGGNLKDTVDKGYFTLIDGFWKRLITIATATPAVRTTIAANAETTNAGQKAAIATAGVATGIFDSLIANASPVLRAASNKVIYCTLALKDALDADIRNNNKGSDLQWKSIFAGIQEATYNGITLRAVPIFDEIIDSYYNVDTSGTSSRYLPYRAVFTTDDNLLVGLESDSEVEDIQIYYNPETEINTIKAKDKVGTLIRQNNLVSVAY